MSLHAFNSQQTSMVDGAATIAAANNTSNDLAGSHTAASLAYIAQEALKSMASSQARKAAYDGATSSRHSTTAPMVERVEADRAPTPIKEEPDYEVAAPEEEQTREQLPWFSLAHHGRHSERSCISAETAEPDHEAELCNIHHEEDGVFVVHIQVKLAGDGEKCLGYCNIPVSDMDDDIVGYYHQRPKQNKPFAIEEVSMGTSFEDATGLVRLGEVTGEDYVPDTYTCVATFDKPSAASSWWAEVYVPKACVPEYKLVDWFGAKDAVVSTETVSEEAKAAEEKAARRCTVVFSREIQAIGGPMEETFAQQMLAEFWTPDGERCIADQMTHILAYELHDQRLLLQLRVRMDESSWWHVQGTMHKEQTSGRFDFMPEPVANAESDEHFGTGWIKEESTD